MQGKETLQASYFPVLGSRLLLQIIFIYTIVIKQKFLQSLK